MRWAVTLAAIIIKTWLWVRLLPRIVGYLVLLVAVCIAAGMTLVAFGVPVKKSHRPAEVICSDPAQRAFYIDYELCEFKLRQASGASRPREG